MLSPSFEVSPYALDSLIATLAKKSKASLSVVKSKLHTSYFKEYFEALKAKTVVIENDYIDRDFIEDFSGYYVRCFHDYPRKCTRIHFFDNEFTAKDFSDLLIKGKTAALSEDKLQNAYLGFIVVKPLPKTIIGRTCLKTYPEEKRRHFPIVRNYTSSLFGINLSVETLAFQEQDRVAAACATSALWSVFQGTGKLFQHPIPSPVEITKQANMFSDHESRSLPSEGLTAAQMAHAVRSVSLEPIIQRVSDEYVLKGSIYAYLRGKIPLIMGADLYDASKKYASRLGKHALAAMGYSLGAKTTKPYQGFLLRASRIDKIYVHDDQVGPFARMGFDDIKVLLEDGVELGSLSTSWKGSDGKMGSVRAIPDFILVPAYHKIRIPFSVVHDEVFSFDTFIENLRNSKVVPLAGRLEWDIYLTTVNDLKKDLFDSKNLDGDYRKGVLLESMPRFMWRATAYNADICLSG